MSTVAINQPQMFTPYVPGTRSVFMYGGNIVRVSWTPETGRADMYAAGKLLDMCEGVGSMTLVAAQEWIAGVLTELSAPVVPVEIQPRMDMEVYPMRGYAGRNSDVVTSWSRVINGKTFDFSRIVWSEGGTTLRVFVGGKTTQLHTWFAN